MASGGWLRAVYNLTNSSKPKISQPLKTYSPLHMPALSRRFRRDILPLCIFALCTGSVNAGVCVRCSPGTSGRCQAEDTACWSYSPAMSTTCPSGAQACTCPACAGGVSGPCHLPDGRCTAYSPGTTLCASPGWECFKGDPYAPSISISPSPSTRPCARCSTPTFGECMDELGNCWDYDNRLTKECPATTFR